ncbi:hypothetical protein ACFYYH_33770 [Streptomyces sp. NPDC002018]|uniref:hypothetical protein n=1 Tax=Streptomyces sp. NPDC002018 TaxID=3364629 RepID=UPI0036AA7E69
MHHWEVAGSQTFGGRSPLEELPLTETDRSCECSWSLAKVRRRSGVQRLAPEVQAGAAAESPSDPVGGAYWTPSGAGWTTTPPSSRRACPARTRQEPRK